MYSEHTARRLWVINIAILLIAIVASFLVDMSGCFPGLGRVASAAVTSLLVFSGFVVNTALLIGDGPSRIWSLVVFAMYVILHLPIMASLL